MDLPARAAADRLVSLSAVLASREARQARQNAWRQRFGLPLISFTPLSPGAVKDTDLTRQVFSRGSAAIKAALAAKQWRIAEEQIYLPETGAEALFAVCADAAALKQAMIALEDGQPAGRLWDIDVLSADGDILCRAAFGRTPRRCLLCPRPAAVCGRSRRHSAAALLARMEAIMCR